MLNRRQQWRRTAPRAEDEGSEKDPFGFLSGLPVPLGAVFYPALPLTPDSMWDDSSRVAYPSLFPPPQPPHSSSLPAVQATSPSSLPRASRQRQGGLKKRGLRGCSRERLGEEQSTCTGRRVRWHPTVRFRVIPGPDDMYAGEQAAVWWSAQELRGFAKEEILRRRYATLQHLNRLDSEEDDSSSSSSSNRNNGSGEGSTRASSSAPLSPSSSATLRVARAASEEGTSSSSSSGDLARRSFSLAAVPVAPAVASAAAIEVVRPYADYGSASSGHSHSQQPTPASPPLAAVSTAANRGVVTTVTRTTATAAGATAACANATVVADADLPPLAHTSAPVSIVVVPPSLSRASSAPGQSSPAADAAANAASAGAGAGPSPSPHRPSTPSTSAPVFCPLASAVSPADFMADLAGPLALLAQERGLDPERVLDPMRHHSFLEGSGSASAGSSAAAGRAATAVAAPVVVANTPSSSFDSGSSEEASEEDLTNGTPLLGDSHRHASVVVEGASSCGVDAGADEGGPATPPSTTEANLNFYSPRPRANSASGDGSEVTSEAAAAAAAPGEVALPADSTEAGSASKSRPEQPQQPQQHAGSEECGGESSRNGVGVDGSQPLQSSRNQSPPGDSSASDDSGGAETASSENSSEGSSGEEEEEAKGEPVTPPLPDVYVQKARRGTAVPSSQRPECNHSSDSSSLSGGSQSGSDEDEDAAAAAAKRATSATNASLSNGNSRSTSNAPLAT